MNIFLRILKPIDPIKINTLLFRSKWISNTPIFSSLLNILIHQSGSINFLLRIIWVCRSITDNQLFDGTLRENLIYGFKI